MKISAAHIKRYKEICVLLLKYGRGDLVSAIDLDESFGGEQLPTSAPEAAPPDQLADDLEAMGPTFVKLGQLLSSRPDLLPEPYLKALSRLQDDVKPFPYEQVEEIVASELGVRISKAFARFDRQPIAAASLGQVHAAALRDGRPVVVKVQRPDITAQIADDFEILTELAEFLEGHTDLGRRYRILNMLEEFRIALRHELDYEHEARNLLAVGANLRDFPRIDVPQPITDYSSRRVLTMDYVRGRKVTAIGPLARLEIQGAELADELFRAYLKQVLVDGLFHADPHPGNVFLTEDRHIALLDLGMVGQTTPRMRDNLLKILLAISDAKSDDVADVLIAISDKDDEFDAVTFRRGIAQLVMRVQDRGLTDINIGALLLRVHRTASDTGLYVPGELTLLGKTLLQLDEIGRILDPAFDPNAAIRRAAGDIMAQGLGREATNTHFLGSLLELRQFAAALPRRLNKLLDATTNAELEVRIRIVDANAMVEGFQKIANRIASGIILAALIVGAALLMRVETSFRIYGYPGLAMLFFIAAAAGGCWLLINIFIQDQKRRRRTTSVGR
ncbi:MAG TPA: AarF/UbiB family protein [Casimicrobiaceae bacterium]|nr:AarF/UbiB family protein [Casimicrobiaceae bacterium]